MNYLLALVPIAIALHFLMPERAVLIFFVSCAAMIPLAGWLGRATEHLAARSGEQIGGLLNATFGNAAELIIALMALHRGLLDVVKASLTGSLLGNLLLVMGCSMFAGGLKHKTQVFNRSGVRAQGTLLIASAIALIVPAAFHHWGGPSTGERALSFDISIILLLTYAAGLIFVLGTHRQLLSPPNMETDEEEHTAWPVRKSMLVLAGSTALVAWVSEILVGSVEAASHALGLTDLFIGIVIVGIVGNAAEHSTAIVVAAKNRMDLSLGVALGSSIQIALFVAPVLVLASYVIAPTPMNLVFTPMEIAAITMAVILTGQVAGDGESNWLEGALLIAVYAILGVAFFFMPEHQPAG